MYAIEFETIVNSPYIKFENYLDFINQKIKIIILADISHKEVAVKNHKIDISTLPTSLNKYIGIVKANEIDEDFKDTRLNYLEKKYL